MSSLGLIERDAQDAAESGCNRITIGIRQCTEPLRVSGVHHGDLGGARDRRSGQTGGAEIRHALIVGLPRFWALAIMTGHNRPFAASISSAATTSPGRRCRTGRYGNRTLQMSHTSKLAIGAPIGFGRPLM